MQKHAPRSLVSLCLAVTLAACLVGLTGCGPKRITGMAPARQGYSAVRTQVGAKVVRTAATQIGKPYRSGGTSPQKGFDCSGLIYWAYQQHGIKVPRVTTSQARAGQPVSRAGLQPGDIVVFRSASSPNGLHTGLYAGEGKFIHSPNSRSKVRMDSLNATHWKKNYLTGRRIVAPFAGR